MTGNSILTVEQAAALLQVRPKTVRALAAEGVIPAAKLGKFWRFDEQLLREWVVLRSRENERVLPTVDVQPLLGAVATRARTGSLGDRLDQLLASPAAAALGPRGRSR
jgi:excisionase family DNA binding protein